MLSVLHISNGYAAMRFRQFFSQLCLAMTVLCGSGVNAETFGQNDLMLSYGLYPASQFLISDGRCTDCNVLPQAGWYFRGETIAVPKSQQSSAGFCQGSIGLRRPGCLGEKRRRLALLELIPR
jgi:hypothetical protein